VTTNRGGRQRPIVRWPIFGQTQHWQRNMGEGIGRSAPMGSKVQVREVQSDMECSSACELAALALQETPAGLTREAWAKLEYQRLSRARPLWTHFGVAMDGERLVGMVVIRLAGDPCTTVSCCEGCCEVGCCSALGGCWAYKLMNDVRIKPRKNDVYVEMVAVHPDFHRQGVATKMMEWVEQQGLHLLMERYPEEIRAGGSRLILEVGVHNVPGIELFQYLGYAAIGRTDHESNCSCCLSAMLGCTFGDPVFATFTKRLSAAYQKAIQSPGDFKGASHVVHVPVDSTQEMTRN